MAENLPINFPAPTEQAIATYSYTDIVTGLGFTDFYFARATAGLFMTTNTDTSVDNPLQLGNKTIGSTNSPHTFDLSPFNTARTIRGTAIFSGELSNVAAGKTVSITLYHYDGTTETAISDTYTSQSSTTTNLDVLIKVPVTTTKFKAGDILRAKIACTGVAHVVYYVDASGDGGKKPSKLSVPFEVSL